MSTKLNKEKIKYSVKELMEKYWEFKRSLMEEYVSFGYGHNGGGGYSKTVYKDNITDFLIWLQDKYDN